MKPSVYTARLVNEESGVATVEIGFGTPATNAELVPAALQALRALPLAGGRRIRFTGPASVPVVSALTHAVAHQYGFVAWFDPKLQRFVIAVSHDPKLMPGDTLVP